MFNISELAIIKECIQESRDINAYTTSKIEIVKKIDELLDNARSYNLCLWEFKWDCRGGIVEGIFKATKEDVQNAIGKDVYFGEILGKHSELYGTLEDGECELLSEDPLYVMQALESGYNPLKYISD